MYIRHLRRYFPKHSTTSRERCFYPEVAFREDVHRWWLERQQREEEAAFQLRSFGEQSTFGHIYFAPAWIFFDWWCRQSWKWSIQLSAKLKEPLKRTFFCSVIRQTSDYYQVSTFIQNKFLMLRSLSAVSSDKWMHCICDVHTKADSWILLRATSNPSPFQ